MLMGQPVAWQHLRKFSAVIFLFINVAEVLANNNSGTCTPLSSIPPECSHLLLNDFIDAEDRAKWMRRITRRGGALFNFSIEDQTLYQTGLNDLSGFGNALSPYWFARALARFAGLTYQMLPTYNSTGITIKDWFTSTAFLKYMPTRVAAPACPNVTMLQRACLECHMHCLLFPHESTVSWPLLRDTIRVETQAAFEAWARDNKHERPVFEPGDVVIQDRCDGPTLLHHEDYGPIAFSFYATLRDGRGIPAATTRNIYVVRDPNVVGKRPQPRDRPFYPCRAMHEALCSRLSRLAPDGVQIHSVGYTSVVDDWARMLYAPTLYKGVSSFTFWAGLANSGTVFSTSLFIATEKVHGVRVDPMPDLGPDWHWVNASVLTGAVANEQLGPGIQPHNLERIIPWLMLN